jgi:hypothetical protein
MAGDPLPQLTMHVIRFVLPSKNKALKKLLLFYWEVVPKKTQDGKLRQEMILVWCDISTLVALISSQQLHSQRFAILQRICSRNDAAFPLQVART